MESRPVELILAHNLAEHLSVAVLLLDRIGSLIFFNEAAEPIIGRSYEETGEMSLPEWTPYLRPVRPGGKRMHAENLGFMRAAAERRPDLDKVRLRTSDESARTFHAVTIPLTQRDGTYLGAMILFWNASEDGG